MNALVRLMSGELDYDAMNDDELVAILAICADNRRAQYEAASRLNDRGKTFAQIVELIQARRHVAVHEATVARWAKRPDIDRRRHRGSGTDSPAT